MSTTTVSLEDAVLEAAAHLYVWALKDIPQDLRDALAAARDRETSVTGIRVLETIHRNVEIADEQKNLVCQDTGIAVYYCRVGEDFPLHPARRRAAAPPLRARARPLPPSSRRPRVARQLRLPCERARSRAARPLLRARA